VIAIIDTYLYSDERPDVIPQRFVSGADVVNGGQGSDDVAAILFASWLHGKQKVSSRSKRLD
jgi:hypothetical protein